MDTSIDYSSNKCFEEGCDEGACVVVVNVGQEGVAHYCLEHYWARRATTMRVDVDDEELAQKARTAFYDTQNIHLSGAIGTREEVD